MFIRLQTTYSKIAMSTVQVGMSMNLSQRLVFMLENKILIGSAAGEVASSDISDVVLCTLAVDQG